MNHSPSIRQANPLEEPGWDKLVMAHPDSTFFHGSAWAKVLHESYNYSPLYFLAAESVPETPSAQSSGAGFQPANPCSLPVSSEPKVERPACRRPTLQRPERLLGLLPAMDVNSRLSGRRGVALPFTDACQPLTSESVPLRALLRELGECGKGRRWNYWECRGVKELPADMPPSLTFYGHALDLSTGEKNLFDHLKSSVRTALRKAEQAGVHVTASHSLEALQTFYSLHCRTRRKHGLPPQPFRFFRNIHRHILSQGLGQVLIARVGQHPIAANVYFHLGTKAIYKYGASDETFQELRGSNLVMWHAIQSYAGQGCQSLHFGRTSITAEGLRRFKLGWGCQEERIDYLCYDCRQGRFVAGKDEAFGWPNAILSRMPIFMLRILGAALYPHMA